MQRPNSPVVFTEGNTTPAYRWHGRVHQADRPVDFSVYKLGDLLVLQVDVVQLLVDPLDQADIPMQNTLHDESVHDCPLASLDPIVTDLIDSNERGIQHRLKDVRAEG